MFESLIPFCGHNLTAIHYLVSGSITSVVRSDAGLVTSECNPAGANMKRGRDKDNLSFKYLNPAIITTSNIHGVRVVVSPGECQGCSSANNFGFKSAALNDEIPIVGRSIGWERDFKRLHVLEVNLVR